MHQTGLRSDTALNSSAFNNCGENLIVSITEDREYKMKKEKEGHYVSIENRFLDKYKDWNSVNYRYKIWLESGRLLDFSKPYDYNKSGLPGYIYMVVDYVAKEIQQPMEIETNEEIIDLSAESDEVVDVNSLLDSAPQVKKELQPVFMKTDFLNNIKDETDYELKRVTINNYKEDEVMNVNDLTNGSEVPLERLVSLPAGAFINQKVLQIVSLPRSVNIIGKECFMNCESLEYIGLQNITHIGEGAFMNCKSLKRLEFLKLISVQQKAFYGCNSLLDLDMSKSIYVKNMFDIMEVVDMNGLVNISKNSRTFSNSKIKYKAIMELPMQLFKLFLLRVTDARELVKRNQRIIREVCNVMATHKVPFIAGLSDDSIEEINKRYMFSDDWKRYMRFVIDIQLMYDFHREDAIKWFSNYIPAADIKRMFDIIERVRQLAFPPVVFAGAKNRHEKAIDPIIFGFLDPLVYNLME